MILENTSTDPIDIAITNSPVTKYEMMIVSIVPTILHEIDFNRLFALLSFPDLLLNSFLSGWSKIISGLYERKAQKYTNPIYFIGFMVKKFYSSLRISSNVLFSSILSVSSRT